MKKEYVAPKIEKLDFSETACNGEIYGDPFADNSSLLTSNEDSGNGDGGLGKGCGFGCDGISGHINQKPFSNSKKKGCY